MLIAFLVESRRTNGQKSEVDVRRIGNPLACSFRNDDDIVSFYTTNFESLDFHTPTTAKNDVAFNGVDNSMQCRRYARLDASSRDREPWVRRRVRQFQDVATLFGEVFIRTSGSNNLWFHVLLP